MKILRTLLVTVCLGLIAFGCWKIYTIQSGYRQGEQAYEKLEEFVVIPSASTAPPAQTESAPTEPEALPAPMEEIIDFPVVDFQSLQTVNPDVVGWIYCEDTAINYPVVQGADNDYYLDHLFDNTPNGSGAIFLDSRNSRDFSDTNSILFGHNMKNGAMFAGLSDFKVQSFYEEHPRFLFVTPEKHYVVEIFAGVVVTEWDPVWQIDFADDEELEQWLENLAAKSEIETGLLPDVTEQILTLSTCSYEYDDARFVVLGILKAV